MRRSSALCASCCRVCSSSRAARLAGVFVLLRLRTLPLGDLVGGILAHVSLSCPLGPFLLEIENFRRGGIQLGFQRRAILVPCLGRAAIVTGM